MDIVTWQVKHYLAKYDITARMTEKQRQVREKETHRQIRKSCVPSGFAAVKQSQGIPI